MSLKMESNIVSKDMHKIPFPWYWREWKPEKPVERKLPYNPVKVISSGVGDDSVFSQNRTPLKSPKMSFEKVFDPYQVFEVDQQPCMILNVKVVCGRNISKGWMDYVDTPDPYIILRIKTAPEGRRRTKTFDNEINPVWNEDFTFLLDEQEHNMLQITLMEANYGNLDQTIGIVWYDLKEIPKNTLVKKTFYFNEVSEIDIEFQTSMDTEPTLRYSLCLCDEEKAFRVARKRKVMESMQNIFPRESGPHTHDEVPTIGVIGSGGGFRAMVGYSGVFKALSESNILDCCSYVCGLSGSSWYISTLYSSHDWPEQNPGHMQEELKNNIDSSLVWLLSPQSVYRYLDRIIEKRRNGQPISFTDIFGHLVGETLLKDRLDTKLTDMRTKCDQGQAPLPLLTCVNVKADRSARSFQEWVEFSPYEIGMPKYGTFMNTELFGSKFFMGKLCKEYQEPPLHFLQGIWGSAFCILFKRLLDDNRKLDPVEMIRQEMVKQIDENQQDQSSDSSDDDDDDLDGKQVELQDPTKGGANAFFNFEPQDLKKHQNGDGGQQRQRKATCRRTKQKGYWHGFLKGVLENKRFELLNTRAGRAGVVHNFMRGLSLQQTFPLSPFTPDVGNSRVSDDFDGIHELHPTNIKHLYMVDAGLTFNSPYPLVLRPQRAVDIILSFDFSARPSDSSPPFKELLLAEKWAKLNKLQFPPIDTSVFDREGLKEMYIFKHPADPFCPIVLHFPLVNIEFRKYVKPGVPRETPEEMDFANFEMFDDPQTPYSTFNFKYSHLAFERLSKLTEFNTLLNIEKIKEVVIEVIKKKQQHGQKLPFSQVAIKNLRKVSVKNKNRLSSYLSRLERETRRRKSGSDVLPPSDEEGNKHVDLTKSESDAALRKMKGKSKSRVTFTRRVRTSAEPSLASPQEIEEEDFVDGDVRKRSSKGRSGINTDIFVTCTDWDDPKCHSDSDEEKFYEMS